MPGEKARKILVDEENLHHALHFSTTQIHLKVFGQEL